MKDQQGTEHLLDDIGWKILSELQQNARMVVGSGEGNLG